MHIRTNCTVQGFNIDVQYIHENFFAGEDTASLLEDFHIWIEVEYLGGNPFVQRGPASWMWLLLPAVEEDVIGMVTADPQVSTLILQPGRTLRAAIVTENIKKPSVPPGIHAAFSLGTDQGPKGLYVDPLQTYSEA